MSTKKAIALILSSVMLLSLLTACGSKGKDGGIADDGTLHGTMTSWPEYSSDITVYASEAPAGFSETAVPNTLTVAMGGEPNTLYPPDGNRLPTIIACRPIYETLINYNSFTREYEPALAESWEMIDETTIQLHLRKGVVCHAGYEMTANDVLWCVQRGSENPVSKFLWSIFDVDKCAVVDEHTINLVTNEPFGALLAYLSNPNVGFIINRQAYEEQSSKDYSRNPTGGTGPYKFVEWVAGDHLSYIRNEEYWGEKPYYPNLVIRNISDDLTRSLSLESGGVDVVYDVDNSSVQTLIESPSSNLIAFPSFQMIHIGLNNKVKPFDNVLVRKAMLYALDLERMVELAFSGTAIVSDSCWPNSLSVYSAPEGDEKYTYDIEKAKALLKEAGYEDSFSFELLCGDTSAWMQMAEMIHNALAKIGIEATVRVMDAGSMYDKTDVGDYSAYIGRFSSSGDDPIWWHDRLDSSLSYFNNACQYKNDRVDELLALARTENDASVRSAYYKEIQSLWRQDLPWISLACPQMIYGIRSTLTGIEPHGYGVGDLRYIHPISAEK